MAVDLGKQYGPLPLGAWIAVVGIGAGIAWYARNQGDDPTVVEDVSGVPGVGQGGSGGWVDMTPPGSTTPAGPTTNEAWAIAMTKWLIAMGYEPVKSETAVRKYLNGAKLSAQEFTLVSLAMAVIGPPPQALGVIPDDPDEPDTPTPPTPTPTKPELFYLEGSSPAVWALANGPSGGWVETNSQLQANVWAATYNPTKNATRVNAATWNSLKAKWSK